MKLSRKCLYALKIILDLSKYYQHKRVHIAELAKRQNIPPKYLEQILIQLKKGGLIQSKKGPRGGYSLTRSPKEIMVGDVIRLTEKALFTFSDFEIHPIEGNDFFGVITEVETAICRVIDKINFAEIQKREFEALFEASQGNSFNI